MIEQWLPDPEAQLAFGARIAALLPPRLIVYLEGDLGTGKTTLTRGVLAGLGHRGAARSPTYTLLEPYELADRCINHLDLYRLGDPQELEYLGLRDLLAEDAVWMVEWPERGVGMLPPPDLVIAIEYVANGRLLRLSARTASGESVLEALAGLASRVPARSASPEKSDVIQ
ncbi:tRNA (adenosine(37)-N6)-threonylcarbamoyltransferase complex ATPase subunit type 1 TsaE [Thiocapsa bogorovii]|uniref:tRNA (adenosine(37)-N6)-threonylcarbamoyltransferase complex ATPase subunit type 1 TsaE n=1 Tax=Thiocapsa bogorovii TaxID=521689 RepID=UPI001E28B8CB|nr:tRNA (adenosine(37)-N6)-threonylcarbamoyltransferase complex ATPase subunit type 1 TsaE [Thiocapsa bogorovii]UHD16189.1 tRNA (adenosine(37)-N6)-threonylcarbamoyltransferase complex ATPase subunit type 1 TsaE [Thiocapsa bogorovii]